jgi:hypothetical protein
MARRGHDAATAQSETMSASSVSKIREQAMTSAPSSGTLVTILPCNDLDASERFYRRLGFVRRAESGDPDYRILSSSAGGHLHLTKAEQGWLVPGRNPCALYLYLEDVEGLAAALQDLRPGRRGPEDKPWGMYEFGISDPDETLVRIGWPSRLRNRAEG